MLLRDKPYDMARSLLSEEHPVFRPIDAVTISISLLSMHEGDSEKELENSADTLIDSI